MRMKENGMKEIVYNTGETSEQLKAEYNPDGSTLRKVQLRMLDMLVYFDQVCKEIGVEYRLDGGTLLGAVRHRGFIPWDDDTDVVVDWKDYKRLCTYLLEHPHPQYVLQCHKTDPNFYNFWNVLRDTKSEYIQDSRIHKIRKYRGMQIDIFPYEAGTIRWLYKIVRKIGYYNSLFFIGRHKILADCVHNIEQYAIIPVFRLISKYFGNKNYYTHNYGCVIGLYTVPKSVLLPYAPLEFEGHIFPGPAKPDEYCRIIYGDYMRLPAKQDRAKHKATYVIYD